MYQSLTKVVILLQLFILGYLIYAQLIISRDMDKKILESKNKYNINGIAIFSLFVFQGLVILLLNKSNYDIVTDIGIIAMLTGLNAMVAIIKNPYITKSGLTYNQKKIPWDNIDKVEYFDDHALFKLKRSKNVLLPREIRMMLTNESIQRLKEIIKL